MNVYLDSAIENRTDELALHAVRVDGEWNGWSVPVATAAEFRRFIAAWQSNDPNGLWDVAAVSESDGVLTLDDDDVPERWESVDVDVDGSHLYAIDGWTWVL